MARLPKRRRISPQETTIFTKTGDLDTCLEVDHMTLDYLSHEAITALLANRTRQRKDPISLQRSLDSVDAFVEMFQAKHPRYTPDPELRFRLLLLKFATLFCQRLTLNATAPSPRALRELRDANHERARDWIGGFHSIPTLKYDMSHFETELPLPRPDLDANRAHILNVLDVPAEDDAYDDAFYGTSASVSMLDILPSFMSMVAARNELNNSTLNPALMHLIADYMLQACLEQYLVRGASGSDAIDEAFAWGFKSTSPIHDNRQADPEDMDSDPADPTDETTRMFQLEDGLAQEVPGWSDVKADYIARLVEQTPIATGLIDHLEKVAADHPIRDLELTLLDFLRSLAASLPAPVLKQLEGGCLEGMTKAETKAFLRECGLGGEWPIEAR